MNTRLNGIASNVYISGSEVMSSEMNKFSLPTVELERISIGEGVYGLVKLLNNIHTPASTLISLVWEAEPP